MCDVEKVRDDITKALNKLVVAPEKFLHLMKITRGLRKHRKGKERERETEGLLSQLNHVVVVYLR
jgi:hypothetical protein